MRVFLNFLAIWALGISLLFGVFDIARSIAQSRFLMMPFLQSWQNYLPEYLVSFSGFIQRNFPTGFWEYWVVPVLSLPGWLLFLILSILLLLLGNMAARLGKKSGL